MIEPVGVGGISDYAAALVRALTAAGVPCQLVTAVDHVTPAPAGVTVHAVVPWLRATSPLRRLLRRARLGPLVNALRFLATVPRILRLARRARVVHVQGGSFVPLLSVLAVGVRLIGVPLVFTPHNTFDRGRSYPRSRALLARCAACTIVHARADLAQLPPLVARRAVVIPHGEYGGLARTGGTIGRAMARADLELGPSEPVVLLFGQLRPDKGVGDLLEAAREVPEVRILLAGEEVGGLAQAAVALGSLQRDGRVLVHEGFQDMSQAARLFAAADVVALPYRRASASGVLLLAYGFERPVVVYPVGGLPEAVLDGETGWICARPDPAALGKELRAIVAAGPEECRRRGEQGAELARTRYSWDRIAEATKAIYADVVRDAPGSAGARLDEGTSDEASIRRGA